MREASKETELDQLGCLRVIAFQFAEGVIECEQVTGRVLDCARGLFEINPAGASASLERAPLACPFDEDPPHPFGCRGEEVAAAIPALNLVHVDQPDVCVVDQRRGLQRLPRLFVAEPLSRQFSQLIVHRRQELLRSLRFALLNRRPVAPARAARTGPTRHEGKNSPAPTGTRP